ncbi:response regulator [Rhodococcus sp. 06-235-1A]|uniref:response regulator n=1 Tax=Rhodococcus sp. 06-235-1A TaxID=2022508 RepID=UPI00117A7E9E|nr:response regulator [Rhodococcus sp. 06-235-1A]
MVRVLLVEDHIAFDRQFNDIFGETGTVDKFENYESLSESNMSGWDYAFVDFELGPGEDGTAATGFSVLEYLRAHSPQTKIIGFTALTENSRPLFAMAAHHWFGAWAVREKRGCTDEILIAIRDDGRNPTSELIAKLLREESWRIDQLFPEANALALWRVWTEHRGAARVIATAFGHFNKNQVEAFSANAYAAVLGIRDKVKVLYGQNRRPGAPTGGGRNDNKGVTLSFVQENSEFFFAPDLQTTLTRVKPWDSPAPAPAGTGRS